MGGLAPVAGIVLGFGLILYSIAQRNVNLDTFTDMTSWLIVFGGSFAATLTSFEPKHLLTSFRSLIHVFRPKSYPYAGTIAKLYRIAVAARTQAALGIESESEDIEDSFFKNAVEKATVTTDHEELYDLLEVQMRVLRKEHRDNQEVFRRMGAYAPAFGMIGTLVGLIMMLGNVESGDISAIADGMATALVTTFLGLVGANLVFLPIATKIGEQSEREAAYYECIVEGVLAAVTGATPARVLERLQSFVPPSELSEVDRAVERAKSEPAAA